MTKTICQLRNYFKKMCKRPLGATVSTQRNPAHAIGKDIAMSATMTDAVKRRNANRKSALVVENIQSRTTVGGASRTYDPVPSAIESWVDDA